MPTQHKIHNKGTSGRRKSIVPHKRPNVLIRLLQRLPGWAWWFGGASIVALYIFFFYYIFVGPFGFRWRALYGDVTYPEGYEIHGIDISHHQGKIDWQKLKDKGLIDGYPIRFVMIKATEGASRIDANFRSNFHNAREYGFTRGAYHFYSVHSPAKAQAEFFIRHVKLENGDLPPVLDVEHKPSNQTDEEFKESIQLWLNMVEFHYGVKPIIYTYYKFKTRYLDDDVFDQYPYWIAHYYVEKVEYQGEWKFWQHTDAGRLPGIKGDVDFNIYNGSFYDLRKMTIGAREQIGEDAYQDNE
ncbi:MAG: glycoside hydrolase family 25 protein [Prevotella sp.]|nr:glycoside hydrolase family 25 protein [Prevotella sp.]